MAKYTKPFLHLAESKIVFSLTFLIGRNHTLMTLTQYLQSRVLEKSTLPTVGNPGKQ
jgi:hypothetical protein